MDNKEKREQELAFLAAERKKTPELFKTETYRDDAVFLEKIGISLPEDLQKNLNTGYLKFLPQDFIVEEVLNDKSVQTVEGAPSGVGHLSGFPGIGPVIFATLVKCGLSTIEAIEEIHSLWHIDKKNIQYAGIKDQDAITSQLISFTGVDLQTVQSISSPHFFLKDIYMGADKVQVGKLMGNRFTILIRTDNTFNQDAFLHNLQEVQKNGFYNFYYSQRFSNPRFINWFWGLQILKGEYKNAVFSALCSEGLRENGYFKNIRKNLAEHFGNWQACREILAPMTVSFHSEIKMLEYLKKNSADFAGALQQIPEQVQLWVFAYPSLFFNRKISQCIRDHNAVPKQLPLLLSRDQSDWQQYSDFLQEDGMPIMPKKGLLKPFPFIMQRKRIANTKEIAQIHDMKILPEGVALSFTLPKGCYATSFLSHMFELVSGVPPLNISTNRVDVKEALDQPNMQNILERFKEIIVPKSENMLDKFE